MQGNKTVMIYNFLRDIFVLFETFVSPPQEKMEHFFIVGHTNSHCQELRGVTSQSKQIEYSCEAALGEI